MSDIPASGGASGGEFVPRVGRSPAGLWNLREAASHLRVSERTVRREVRAKRLHCVHIGRRLLFDPADVSRFVAARKD
jgi:excisionase family DNA binding protein